MAYAQSTAVLAVLNVSSRVNEEPVLRLVQASLRNGLLSEAERQSALETAQQNGVTISEYLRGRLLVQAGIAVETSEHSDKQKAALVQPKSLR